MAPNRIGIAVLLWKFSVCAWFIGDMRMLFAPLVVRESEIDCDPISDVGHHIDMHGDRCESNTR